MADVDSAIRRVRQHIVLDVAVANGMLDSAKNHLEGLQNVLKVELKDDEIMRVFLNHYERHLLDQTVLYPGVRDVLDYFSGKQRVVVTFDRSVDW